VAGPLLAMATAGCRICVECVAVAVTGFPVSSLPVAVAVLTIGFSSLAVCAGTGIEHVKIHCSGLA
jgi:hypothetical protein